MKAPRAALLAGLFLAALSLRPQLVGVGPLLPRIQSDLGVSHALAGLLGTIPVLCMGLFAPPAPFLSARIGSRAAIAGSVALIGAAGIARAFVPGVALVILLTLPVGIGMGLAGALMPVAVKERFPHRPAFATGIYATGINCGAAASSAIGVPLATATWGWRGALFVFSAFAAVLPLLWLVATSREAPHRRVPARPPRLPWRSPLAWRLVGIFFLMSTIYYGVNSWLPDAFQEHGWSEGRAAALLAVVNTTQLVSSLAVPWLSDRHGSRRLYLLAGASQLLLALAGMVLFPGAGWFLAVAVGLPLGALFPLIMTLPLDIARRPAEVGAIAGMMLGVGYSVSSVSPFLLGVVRDATGSFTGALWLLVAAAAGLLAGCAAMSHERLSGGVTGERAAPAA